MRSEPHFNGTAPHYYLDLVNKPVFHTEPCQGHASISDKNDIKYCNIAAVSTKQFSMYSVYNHHTCLHGTVCLSVTIKVVAIPQSNHGLLDKGLIWSLYWVRHRVFWGTFLSIEGILGNMHTFLFCICFIEVILYFQRYRECRFIAHR